MRVTTLTLTDAPTSNFVRGPVNAAARMVDTVVMATDRATSPFAIRVTRLDAVPPVAQDTTMRARRGGGGHHERRTAAEVAREMEQSTSQRCKL